MSKKLLLRADDLGYSEAVNYGIEKSVKEGLIRSLGVMVNMPATEHGVNLIKDCDIALGVHTNICAERPLTDPRLIPSLVDDNGYFKSSRTYREAKEDFVVFEEVILEIEAQYHRFVELFGRKPDYFEGHAVASQNFFKGLEHVANKFGLKYSPFSMGGEPVTIGHSQVTFTMDSMLPDYDPLVMLEKIVALAGDDVVQLAVFHPGYLDHYLLTHSTLLNERCLEVEILTDPRVKEWLVEQDVILMDYRQL
ncbi:ChbG/HpnK family deacetylase [Streptococcus ovuberis]|uniref:ChbG/HpnK family deacetylase n=1 Tax=Streptococcus ovuberis TaxID=1936207 RepID=A0A7X6N0C8_9STRE|nr:ChbG/HpnK family deacetylase [Streptococcus ovuberis]NKZ21044.1 ChbG/HpnK family deacetylase [Streptococcus ovuberis]